MKVSLIGYGEAGQIFAGNLKGVGVRVWDTAPDVLMQAGCGAAKNAAQVAAGADLVICAVTAAQTVPAAAAAAPGLAPGTWYLDVNSASPVMKQSAALIISQAGGRYVEAAIMSPLPPKLLATSILIGGPHGEAFLDVAARIGFTAMEFFSPEVGQAAATKMCRSVMVKGVEALLLEALMTARRHRVEETVIASLTDLFPGPDWRTLAQYMISRTLAHGARRAEEMREVAATVEAAGGRPLMSLAIAEHQDWAATCGVTADQRDLTTMLDALLAALKDEEAQC